MGQHVANPLGRHAPPAKQTGVVLFIALIALVVMMLAAIALVRTTGIANIIAGNMAFKQAATQAGDAGIELALKALPTIVQNNLNTALTGQYSPTELMCTNASGTPTNCTGSQVPPIAWANVPCYDPQGNTCTSATAYQIQYFIDRLCTSSTLPVTDLQADCVIGTPTGTGSGKSGSVVFSGATLVYYRVTVKVQGPRNTVSYVQAWITD
ncbi:MAG: pilus assembly PilX N-terminal domain-containing protein [Betaproteobacteria bacterium]|nr:pilus assembly PilX N-terminal domain-containing protein [Betaproteobacteria bacterium]